MRSVHPRQRSSGTPGSLHTALAKVAAMIEWGQRLGYTQAAINLKQWRDAKGDRILPASAFSSERFLLRQLQDKHRPRFLEGVRKRLQSGALAPGKNAEMDWTDSVLAPFNSDLWFALGGFTVHSHVTVSVVPAGGNASKLRFVLWQTDISDTYNWDAGKATAIPGVGRVTDDEMLALEKAGYGKAFRITSEKATIVDPAITGDEIL